MLTTFLDFDGNLHARYWPHSVQKLRLRFRATLILDEQIHFGERSFRDVSEEI